MATSSRRIAELEAHKAELDSQIKAATPDKDAGEDGDDAEAGDDDEPNAVDEAQLKAWKKELTAVKKDIKAKNESFTRATERGGRWAGTEAAPPSCC